MTEKYIIFDEYIRQGKPVVDEGGLKGQQAVSPRQRPWQISTMRIITAPKGHKHQEYGTITM